MSTFGSCPGGDGWGDGSGYVPPNSDLRRHGDTMDGLPAPLYETPESSGPYIHAVDWAEVVIEWAVEWAGGENTSAMLSPFGLGPDAQGCRDCGVAWVGESACWNCQPRPAPCLIVPGRL